MKALVVYTLRLGNGKRRRNQGRWKEAEELQLQVKDARFRVLGAEHPDTLQAIGDLAVMYSNTGQWGVGGGGVQMRNTRLGALGEEHPSLTHTVT